MFLPNLNLLPFVVKRQLFEVPHPYTTKIRRVLFEKRPALYFSNYKENYKLIHVCWIPQNDDFMYIMEQYFHY